MERPALQAALTRLHPKKRDVEGIVVARLDRLSRSVHQFFGLLALANARRFSIVAFDLGIDTETITGKLVAQILCAIGEWEREIIGQRTSAAMQVAKRNGQRFGPASALKPTTGSRLIELRRTLTLAATADVLNKEGHTTATGVRWTGDNVAKAQRRLLAA